MLAVDPPELTNAKAALRQEMRRLRAGLTPAGQGAQLAAALPEAWLGAGMVGGYWPLGSEIDPRPLLARLTESGAQIALPHMRDRAGPPVFLVWRAGEALTADAFGMMAPELSAPVALHFRLLLVPLLAFDRRGGRLGQGGGHYDRVIAGLDRRAGLVAGLAFAEQEVEAVPMGAGDQRLDAVLTPKGAIDCGGVLA
jgi:5-formyltetrahydrofolate cyclo-ligase